MGMAASQARYLTLSARKTNVEYEGQQINQARTSLANQSASLFNQMLSMEVPTPPSTTDFTTIQYSFSDGANVSVLSNYYQLGKADSDYNYVVTTYHNEKVYTGSRKKLNDPQVQATVKHDYSYDPASLDNNTHRTVKSVKQDGTSPNDAFIVATTDGTTKVFRPVTAEAEEQVKAINLGNGNVSTSDVKKFADKTVDLTNTAVKANYAVASTDDDKAIIAQLYGIDDPSTITLADYYVDKSDASHPSYITKEQYNETDTTKQASTVAKNVEQFNGKGINQPVPPATSVQQDIYTDGTSFVSRADLQRLADMENPRGEDISFITTSDAPTFSNYSAVGNCILTELTPKDMQEEDIKTEIDQIIKDMQAQGGDPVAAANLAACFDSDGNYKGGIYQFTMNGTKYFTTKNDLDLSLSRPIVENGIDVQQDKLKYYNATYLEKRVEETQKALLETDGKGRFSSVKLENDSVKYTLNTETVTDEDAYNDAMNQYYYKNAEYEKALADINAKTEVIQAQDRTLELRLEQLATEQSALQNEMEAVKKVVDKHVEAGFKTFGG